MTTTEITPTETTTVAATARRVPWQGITTAFNTDEKALSQVVLKAGGLDYDVSIRPLYRTLRDGTVIQCSHDREVYRDEPGHPHDEVQLGTVRTRYTPLANREVYAFGDIIVEAGDGAWHACGQQNNGSRTFMVMNLSDEFTVLGDKHQMVMTFRSAHDGSGAIRADALPFRTACFNLNQIRATGTNVQSSWRILHTTNLKVRMEEAEVSIKRALAYRDAYMAAVEKLAKVEVNPEQGLKLIGKLVKRNRTRRDEVIADIQLNWLSSKTIPDDYRFTGWGLLNAVTEYFGHIASRRGTGNSLYESLMTGEGAKARETLVRLLV